MIQLVDSHCHIDGPEYDADRVEVITRARECGVSTMLNVGTGDPNAGVFERVVALAEQHDEVYAAVGVHPHDAKLFDDRAEALLAGLFKQSRRVLAWGEIGLDYHYDHSPRDVQREVFRRQLQQARALDVPVIIHSRAADADTIKILQAELSDCDRAGVLHCFGGSLQMAREALALGFCISFAGNLTFKSATDLRAVAHELPIDRLLVETDCPYLTPVPFRGRRNEPARVIETARCLAEICGVTFEKLAEVTSENFNQLFRV